MAKARKTVTIIELVARANAALEATPNEWWHERDGICLYISAILHDTGNYRGFSYLPSELDSNGRLLKHYDGTRRVYQSPEV
jgi:hypothetical protein